MSKKYPLTYEEYEKKIIELYIKSHPKEYMENCMERLNKLLEEDPDFIKGLYAETCFRYDHPELYGEMSKKVFDDYLLESIPVNTLNLLLGGEW